MKSIKKLTLVIFSLLFALSACSKDQTSVLEEGPFKVGLLLDNLGLEDNSINDSTYAGLIQFSENTGVELLVEQASNEEVYLRRAQDLVDDGAKLIFGPGYALVDTMVEAAIANPKATFVSIDGVFDEKTMPHNLIGVNFRNQELAFVAGYIAGNYTQTNRVSYIGSMQGFLTDQDRFGFEAGVYEAGKELSKQIRVDSNYIDSYTDDIKAREITNKVIEDTSDVIYADGAGASLAIMETASRLGKKSIGKEEDFSNFYKDSVLTSTIKEYGVVAKDLSEKFMAGNIQAPANFSYGMAERAFSYIYKGEEDANISSDLNAKAQSIIQAISSGDIKPPYNQETYDQYTQEVDEGA